MQAMVQRTPEINRNTNNDGSRAETHNSQFSEEFKKVVQQGNRQVVHTQQTEGEVVDPDGRNSKDGRRQRRRPGSKPESEENDDKKNPEIGQGMLDIRI
jgi:hypothetical protein